MLLYVKLFSIHFQSISSIKDMLTPVHSCTLPQPLCAMLLHQNTLVLGINGMVKLICIHFYELYDSRSPLHAHDIVQLQFWDAISTTLTLKTSLKIAGNVVSLDSWNDFIAVGSSVVQLIHLKPGADPTRILYAKGRDHLQVYINTSAKLLSLQ